MTRPQVPGHDATTSNPPARVPGPYSGTSAPTDPVTPRKVHPLKSQPEPFRAVWDQRKRHEVRKNDRGIQQGDQVLLREWISPTVAAESGAIADISGYTGREILVLVGHITSSARWPGLLASDTIVFDIEELARCENGDLSRSVVP